LSTRVDVVEREWRRQPTAPDILLEARADLAVLALRYGDQHPRYQDQQRKLAALERHLHEATPATYELNLARAMREYYSGRYDDNPPRMQELAVKIRELEREQATAK